MREGRVHFHDELERLESHMGSMGVAARDLFERALRALVEEDVEACDEVIAGDDEIDRYYVEVEEKILELFALQTPVAGDLRLLTVILHINLHLERVGDMAVNLAKITKLASGLPRSPTVIAHIEEMGTIALRMLEAAMESFARRDMDLAHQLPAMDDPIDRLNRNMLGEVLKIAGDKRMLEWGIRMHVVSRQVERVGDHAVDIAEQVAFLMTGEFEEFTDASHPELEQQKLS